MLMFVSIHEFRLLKYQVKAERPTETHDLLVDVQVKSSISTCGVKCRGSSPLSWISIVIENGL